MALMAACAAAAATAGLTVDARNAICVRTGLVASANGTADGALRCVQSNNTTKPHNSNSESAFIDEKEKQKRYSHFGDVWSAGGGRFDSQSVVVLLQKRVFKGQLQKVSDALL